MSNAEIADREAELAALQGAFDEYISSSRELEEELDAELSKMQEKLAESSAANAALSSQLDNIAPQLSSLERSLTDTRAKLEREQKLRRQAEQAQDESETRLREVEGDLLALRDECDAAHEELAFRESELEETRLELDVEQERHRVELDELRSDLAVSRQSQNGSTDPREGAPKPTENGGTESKRSSLDKKDVEHPSLAENPSDDYVKRLEDELELVTEQLIETEHRLTTTEEDLADAEARCDRACAEKDQVQRDPPDVDALKKLQEEAQLHIAAENKLREEISLVQEELTLTQEELKASEEDRSQNATKLESIRVEHRDEVHNLQLRLEQTETEARTAVAEVATLEKTLTDATEETVRLRTEISNLETALLNGKKDQDALVEELEAVNMRFDVSRREAELATADSVRSLMKEEMNKEMEEMQSKLQSLSDVNLELQAKVDEAETAIAAARDRQNNAPDSAHSELVITLQDQLSRTKESLDQKAREIDNIRESFEGRVSKAEADVTRLEKELSTTKGKLAEAEANLIVIRREKERATATIPKQKGKQRKTKAAISSAKTARITSEASIDSRDDYEPSVRGVDDSNSFSRRLRSVRRRRARSTSPTTPQRLIYRVEEEEEKADTLRKEYDSLQDQNRMGDVRVKRLEEDLQALQTQLFTACGDTAVVPQQMSRISSLASPEKGSSAMGDIRALGESHVEELIERGDMDGIVEELRKLDQKCDKQREYNAQLLSKILSLQGNIQVYCRVRPMRMSEIHAGNGVVVEALSETEVGCHDQRSNKWKSFGFDRVWGPDQSQNSVFQDVEPLALSVVDGYNACIFAYGQTGSGKTYTMEGIAEENQYGISYRTIQKIFNLLNLRAHQQKAAAIIARSEEQDDVGEFVFSLHIGMLEIYNDEVYDLLSLSSDVTASAKKRDARKNGTKATLTIRRNEDGQIEVPGLIKQPVESINDVMKMLKTGNSNRATAATDLNEHSSRSHMVLAVDVKSSVGGQPGNNGTLYLVDLAGSERVRKSNVEGEQLKEAGYINKSLAALGNVMEALDRKASHVPYRDSKLTYLLQDALGGNSRTMMVVAVCPMDGAFDESVHALKFATRVRRIQLGAAQRNVTSKNLEETVKSLTSEMKKLTKAKERSEHQLHSLKRDNLRIQERLASFSQSRAQAQTENRSVEILRKNNTEMANRWQKEKSLREDASAELDKCRDEIRGIQQTLSKTTRERDALSRRLDEKESLLAKSSKDLRRAKEASSAATLRARTAQIMSRTSRTPARASAVTSSSPPPKSTPSSTPRSSPRPKWASTPEEVEKVRGEVLALLEKYDSAKVDRIDIIMEKFKGKENLLLDKMKQRYENGGAAASMQRRSELALARHKERLHKRKESQ